MQKDGALKERQNAHRCAVESSKRAQLQLAPACAEWEAQVEAKDMEDQMPIRETEC
jgi:hypothetical protein